MTSFLAGSLARSIGKAFADVFFDATLTRAGAAYPCKGLISKWGKYPGASSTTEPTFEVLILAKSLAIEPAQGDVVALQGQSFTIFSGSKTKMAVSLDPAGAVWTVLVGAPGSTNQVGGSANTGAALAASLGRPYQVFRSSGSNPLTTVPIATTKALFTVGSSAGFSLTKSLNYETFAFNGAFDETDIQIGDYLVGQGETYFVADLPYLLPPVCVLCSDTITLTRPNSQRNTTGGQARGLPSQPGSTGTYRGLSSTRAVMGPGEAVQRENVPAALVGTTGRATGTGELPSDAPGPSRWRVYLPPSAFPNGSVETRDILTDQFGRRFQVSVAYFSALGYRAETVELES